MSKRPREIFHDGKGRKKPERHMDNILRMPIPVRSLSKASRPGTAALGNRDAIAREFTKFSQEFLRPYAAGSKFEVWVYSCGNYRRISVSRLGLFSNYRKQTRKLSDVWVSSALPCLYFSVSGSMFCFRRPAW
ncbi:hypothetical protein SMKI_07G2420 [Saccharomyces mikatae IFO 1815]|uniref:Uncharacterized protein n=1 Tax=Saccharomyces mikatae IFO 1815 TaxID=226126 RepID=A0AA35J0K5_SACMI|nr:uncharacterized protein SMKI_07G2420 [Saccharomyces mikatae IFO 1815]CAI4039261.1 hypothetical protein SMKI_07G2420 [Saccharomyces mikatae IFO 1815]